MQQVGMNDHFFPFSRPWLLRGKPQVDCGYSVYGIHVWSYPASPDQEGNASHSLSRPGNNCVGVLEGRTNRQVLKVGLYRNRLPQKSIRDRGENQEKFRNVEFELRQPALMNPRRQTGN